MIRERVAFAYPGRRKIGLSLWTVEDRTVRQTAVGSVEAAAVGGVLDRFQPDLLVIEPGREGDVRPLAFRATADALTFINPRWRYEARHQPLGRVGYLAQNAWRMGVWYLIHQSGYRLGVLAVHPLDPTWLEANAPPRRERAA